MRDTDSDDSIKDPDCTCEERLPSCVQNDLNETLSGFQILYGNVLTGVNTILFTEEFFKIVEKVSEKYAISEKLKHLILFIKLKSWLFQNYLFEGSTLVILKIMRIHYGDNKVKFL